MSPKATRNCFLTKTKLEGERNTNCSPFLTTPISTRNQSTNSGVRDGKGSKAVQPRDEETEESKHEERRRSAHVNGGSDFGHRSKTTVRSKTTIEGIARDRAPQVSSIANAACRSLGFNLRNKARAFLISRSVPLSAAVRRPTVVGWSFPQTKTSAFARRAMLKRSNFNSLINWTLSGVAFGVTYVRCSIGAEGTRAGSSIADCGQSETRYCFVFR